MAHHSARALARTSLGLTPGLPKIRPAELLKVGGLVTLAFLWCSSCLWEIDQAQLDKLPESRSKQHHFCPGLRWARAVPDLDH